MCVCNIYLVFEFRISQWIDEEEDMIIMHEEASSLQYVVLDMDGRCSISKKCVDYNLDFSCYAPFGGIDISGISMLEELKKSVIRRGYQVAV